MAAPRREYSELCEQETSGIAADQAEAGAGVRSTPAQAYASVLAVWQPGDQWLHISSTLSPHVVQVCLNTPLVRKFITALVQSGQCITGVVVTVLWPLDIGVVSITILHLGHVAD
jgi:hypothetical protein